MVRHVSPPRWDFSPVVRGYAALLRCRHRYEPERRSGECRRTRGERYNPLRRLMRRRPGPCTGLAWQVRRRLSPVSGTGHRTNRTRSTATRIRPTSLAQLLVCNLAWSADEERIRQGEEAGISEHELSSGERGPPPDPSRRGRRWRGPCPADLAPPCEEGEGWAVLPPPRPAPRRVSESMTPFPGRARTRQKRPSQPRSKQKSPRPCGSGGF